MNFILLWITLKLSKGRSATWRMCISAAIGGVYAVLLFIPGYEFLQRISLKLCLSLIMILVAYDIRGFKEFIKIFIFFYIVTFIFGGAAFGLYYFFEDLGIMKNGVFYIKNYPIKILLVSCLVVIISSRFLWSFIQIKFSKEELLYDISISFGEDRILTQALLDTGNTLYDPVSNFPVVVIEYTAIRELLPSEVKAIFENSLEDDLENITKQMSKSSWIGRFRLIPFTALGKENGMLIGFKPDILEVFIDESWVRAGGVIIGIYNNRLSKTENYHALMNPEIIQ